MRLLTRVYGTCMGMHDITKRVSLNWFLESLVCCSCCHPVSVGLPQYFREGNRFLDVDLPGQKCESHFVGVSSFASKAEVIYVALQCSY